MLRGGTAPLSAPVSRDGPCSCTDVPRPSPPVAVRARLSRSSLRTAAPCGLGDLSSAPLRLRGHPKRIRQVSGGPRPWQRPERSSHRVPPPFRSEAGPAGSPGPGDARAGAAAAAAVPPRSPPGPSPRFSRVTFRARAQPIIRPGASVTGNLFPPANRWAGKSKAAPLGAGPEGEAVRLLPSYWAAGGLTAPGEALIGPPRRGRGEAGWRARAGLARCGCGRAARANPAAAQRSWRARRVKGAAWRGTGVAASLPWGGGSPLLSPAGTRRSDRRCSQWERGWHASEPMRRQGASAAGVPGMSDRHNSQ